jgi:hypothetical protein
MYERCSPTDLTDCTNLAAPTDSATTDDSQSDAMVSVHTAGPSTSYDITSYTGDTELEPPTWVRCGCRCECIQATAAWCVRCMHRVHGTCM